MPKVSVLMPVYNTKEEYLRESVESILNQTFKDFELIIVDDGSSENIENILKDYEDKRIKFYKNEQNLGVSKTRNKLLDSAQGEYCAFQDSDDISYPDRLEKQVNFMDENKDISILGSNLQRFPGNIISKYPKFPCLLDFLAGCVISQGTSMLRIEDFRKNKLRYNESLTKSEDYELWSRAIKILKFAVLEDVLLKYRNNNVSLTKKKVKNTYEIEKNIKKRLLDELTKEEGLQIKILKTVFDYYNRKNHFGENIFSVRNSWDGDKKIKIITILGIKIKINKQR